MSAPRISNRLKVRRIPKGATLLLPDAECCVFVLRGSCLVRESEAPAELLAPGTLVVRESNGSSLPDRAVARALELMCKQLDTRWTVEHLARAVGLSRPAFAKRFVLALGMPPLRYLSELRLELAANLLQSSDASLAELAQAVGYASEFAFSRAFKRRFGVAPSFFRRRTAGPTTVALLRAA
ncbi:MAG TPA: AraC family transcriptional regulator [Polyangiaceae bacterium]|nr:AraC family transcriptional regulator [Polyangiaceae bacterium]